MTRGSRAGPGVVLILTLGVAGCGFDAPDPAEGSLSAVGLLADTSVQGYATADSVRPFHFPEDHGAHPDYRTEWWYLTGNLRDDAGRAYGLQFTVFRAATSPTPPPAGSAWATNQVYMAHLAVSDSATRNQMSFERFARGAAGLAGARATPFRVWLEDWALESEGRPFLPLRLEAADDGVEVRLQISEGTPMTLQGDRGLSAKSGGGGNASYYYSLTRLPARGTLVLDGEDRAVSGQVWIDREWSTSVLSPDQTGWDWFSIQLDDGRDLMVFRLRDDVGGASRVDGTRVSSDGNARRLTPETLRFRPLRHWEAPDGRARYPVEWRLEIPEEGLDLHVTPLFDAQELHHAFRYWEGAVRYATPGGGPGGVGYLEMTGYDTPATR